MKTYWENEGKANDKGEFAAVIDLEDGSGIQRFVGGTEFEVANKLLVAQGNATKKIREQSQEINKKRTPDLAKPNTNFQRKPLDADERFTVAQNITDPASAPEAIRTVIESEFGAPISEVRERLAKEEVERQKKAAFDEATAFAAETPDFESCPHNAELLANYCMKLGWAPTRNSFAKAWEDLKSAGLVVLKKEQTEADDEDTENQPPPPPIPETTQQQSGLPAQPAVTVRPRGQVTSSGVRNGDSSATPGTTRTVAKKYTAEQIESMGIDEYQHKLRNEAGFAEFCDELSRPKPKRA